MVILLSTRGTAGSDNWFMCLVEKPMMRSYRLWAYDWTPLSQNPDQICYDNHRALWLRGNDIGYSSVFGLAREKAAIFDFLLLRTRSWSSYPIISVQWQGIKSIVYDFGLSRGVVLSRAAATLRSIETFPLTRWFVSLDLLINYSYLVNAK